jgi:hypothetical protein
VTTDVVAQLLGRLGDITESTARAVEESQRAARELGAQTGALRGAAESFTRLADEMRVANRTGGGRDDRPGGHPADRLPAPVTGETETEAPGVPRRTAPTSLTKAR